MGQAECACKAMSQYAEQVERRYITIAIYVMCRSLLAEAQEELVHTSQSPCRYRRLPTIQNPSCYKLDKPLQCFLNVERSELARLFDACAAVLLPALV